MITLLFREGLERKFILEARLKEGGTVNNTVIPMSESGFNTILRPFFFLIVNSVRCDVSEMYIILNYFFSGHQLLSRHALINWISNNFCGCKNICSSRLGTSFINNIYFQIPISDNKKLTVFWNICFTNLTKIVFLRENNETKHIWLRKLISN